MHSSISQYLELTLLKQTATLQQVEQLCKDAISNNYAAVCVPPLLVKKAKEFTTNSSVKVATVIGYPYGFNAVEAKLAEVILAMVDGANELNMAINITALKNNDWQYLAREINTILPITKSKQKILKLTLQSSLLVPDELIKCCDIYGAAGVDYFSLVSGNENAVGAVATIKLVRHHLANAVKIMVNNNSNDRETIAAFIDAGANRIVIEDFSIRHII